MKYKKVVHNENAIEIDGKIVLSFDKKYKEYLKWRDENPKLEKKLQKDLESELKRLRLYNNGSPHLTKDEQGIVIRKVFYYENGNKHWDGQMKGDNLHGKCIQYNTDGTYKSVEHFNDGVLEGDVEYYRQGELERKGSILSNFRHGEFKSFWVNGNVRKIENYKMGMNHGEFKEYRIDGSIEFEGTYNENYKDRIWTWYFPNTNKKRQEVYEDRYLSEEIQWNKKGQILSYINKSGGVLDGTSRTWYDNGNKKKFCTYKRHDLEGKYTEWFFGGKKRCEGLMKNDKMDGKWFFWYSNGKLALECDFDYGNLINNAKIYHDNGLLKEEVKL